MNMGNSLEEWRKENKERINESTPHQDDVMEKRVNQAGPEKSKHKEKTVPVAQVPKVTAAPREMSEIAEHKVIKIFDLSYIKVRRTYPDSSDESHRWFFGKTTVTISRSREQRVIIAGDRTGDRSWAVDDEILINWKKFKGSRAPMEQIGLIPSEKKVPPLDITNLVPAGRDVTLDIRLTDYGVFWGNTALFVVIKN